MDVATALCNMGEMYLRLGRLPEAEVMFKRAVAIFEAALGPVNDHTRTARRGLQRVQRELKSNS